MKKLFFILPVLLLVFSCERKRESVSSGIFKDQNGIDLHFEIYTERDSFFRSISDPRNGQLYSIQRAATLAEIEDSSFTETVFSPGRKIIQLKSFLLARPAGEWHVWNEQGVKTSYTRIQNGRAIEYRSWFDDGKLRVEGKVDDSDSLARSEYFSNGNPDRIFRVDSLGNGNCRVYFLNGKPREEGALRFYGPSGTWKRFDSLGNALADTVYNPG